MSVPSHFPNRLGKDSGRRLAQYRPRIIIAALSIVAAVAAGLPSPALAAPPPPLLLKEAKKAFDGYLDAATGAVRAANLGGKLPFVGDGIEQGTGFLSEIRSKLGAVLDRLPNARDMSPAALEARLLAEVGDFGLTITPVIQCGNVACGGAAEVTRVLLTLDAGQGSPDNVGCGRPPCPAVIMGGRRFAIGLPGLKFKSDNATVTSTVSWHLKVTVGVDAAGAFLLPGSNSPELRVGLDVVLPADLGMSILGFVQVAASAKGSIDGHGGFRGTFSFDATGGEIRAASAVGVPTTTALTAVADATIGAVATVGSALPGIGADLRVHWDWTTAAPASTAGLSVGLDKVYLLPKTFLDDALRPILDGLRSLVQPILPVAEVLNKPIPGFSDVFGDTTVVDLARAGATGSHNVEIEAITQLIAIASKLTVVVGNVSNGQIDLGKVSFDKAQLLSTSGGSLTINPGALTPIIDKCGVCKQAVQTALDVIKGGPTLTFPVLDDPKRLVGVLVGNDVDLVTFDSNRVDVSDTFGGFTGGSFAGYGLKVVEPTIDIHARVTMGYDTFGLRDAVAKGRIASIADGLWIGDDSHLDFGSRVGLDLSVNFGVVSVGLTGGITLNGFARVRGGQPSQRVRPAMARPACLFELGGKVAADIGIVIKPLVGPNVPIPISSETLIDFQALDAQKCANPNARPVLAEVEGSTLVLNVGERRERRNPPGETGFQGTGTDHESALVTAERRQPDGTQVVRVDLIGFTSAFVSTAAKPITGIAIRALGYEGSEALMTATDDGRPFDLAVTVLGADGGNNVNARTDASHLVFFTGSKVADNVVTGDADDSIFTGEGNDSVSLGKGNDKALGGPGNDRLNGGPGTDLLLGQDGDDVLIAGNGSSTDVLAGGLGNDQLFGSAGADRLFGDECDPLFNDVPCSPGYGLNPDAPGLPGGGNDILSGAGGPDGMVGGTGNDAVYSASSSATGAAAQRVTAYGGGGADVFVGGPGPDTFYGGPGDDGALGGGDSDLLVGGAGSDTLGAGITTGLPISPPDRPLNPAPLGAAPQADELRGGPGGDNLLGSTGADVLEGGPDADFLDGAEGDDLVVGGSQVAGTPDSSDTAVGGAGDDVVIGDNGDRVGGAARLYDVAAAIGGGDVLSGDAGADTVLGGPGADTMIGGDGDDRLEGGAGADGIDGGNGQDDIVGGSSPSFLGPVTTAAVGDVGDAGLVGGAGHDVILGDNGTITRGPVVADDPEAPDRISRTVRFLDSGPAGTVVGGGDRISGGAGHDVAFGQTGDDVISGDDGTDILEGNQGADTIQGGAGQDDIVGGTTPAALPSGATTSQFADAGDTLLAGDAGHDVILGDNGTITRGPVVADDPEAPDRISRTVRFLDSGPAGTVVGGGDRISGGAGHDLLFGQTGDDVIAGDDGNDLLEGNQGADVLDGGAGQDDIVGGTTPTALPTGLSTGGFADTGDTLVGGDGTDVLVGDNAVIGHVLAAGGRWATSPADGRYRRTVTLADRTAIGGPDVILGGGGNDDAFGGLGDDRLHGGTGQDYLEGNQGADTIDGSAGDDDIVGGTSPIGVGGDEKAAGSTPDGADVIHGRAPNEPGQIPPSGLAIGVDSSLDGNGLILSLKVRYGPIPEPAPGTEPDGDVVAGDNARIDRCRPDGLLFRQWNGRDGCTWSTTTVAFYGPTTSRWVQTLGQPLLGLGILDELFPDDHSGNDVIYGDDGDDLLLGQGGSDTIHGGAGDDIVYGGLGPFNKLYGDGGGIDVVILPPDLSLLALVGVV